MAVGDPTTPQTLYFGYPNCFTVWDPSPFNPPLLTGQRWTTSPNATFNDTTCNSIALPARLSMMAHSAPLDIKFFYPPSANSCITSNEPNEWGSFPCSWNGTALVSFHGSWDRTPPTGYKVVSIPWTQAPSTSTQNTSSFGPIANWHSQSGYQDLLYTAQVESGGSNNCPTGCTRPVGLAFDKWGRLYISSDSSGEIFRVRWINASSNGTNGTGGVNTSSGNKNSLSAFVLAFAFLVSMTWH